jgi:hypothetical protein
MGGNAIKKVKISRINLSNYNKIKKLLFHICTFNKPIYDQVLSSNCAIDLCNGVNNLSKYINVDFIYDVPGKNDFGDIDVLYISDDKINIKDLIIKLYNPEEIVVNGDVTSFAYNYKYTDFIVRDNNLIETKTIEDYYQIDLIKCKNLKNMISSKFYFSYGDLGGILGTILKYYGITFGSLGLWCNIKKETIKEYTNTDYESFDFDKIILTEDPQEICKYLNLDYKKWCDGFDSKESIFKWITNCKFFNKTIYLSIKLNHRDSHRYKRPFYNEFLNYIKYNMINLSDSNLEINKNKQLEALKYFNKMDELNLLIDKNLIKIERKKKFNAKHFIKYGYEGKELGNIIVKFKKYIEELSLNNFDYWLDNNSEESIISYIYFYVNNKKYCNDNQYFI